MPVPANDGIAWSIQQNIGAMTGNMGKLSAQAIGVTDAALRQEYSAFIATGKSIVSTISRLPAEASTSEELRKKWMTAYPSISVWTQGITGLLARLQSAPRNSSANGIDIRTVNIKAIIEASPTPTQQQLIATVTPQAVTPRTVTPQTVTPQTVTPQTVTPQEQAGAAQKAIVAFALALLAKSVIFA